MQPSLWQFSWFDQKVWIDVLQAVFSQQCKGNWLHQGLANISLDEQFFIDIYFVIELTQF